jgi:hypothetical protein
MKSWAAACLAIALLASVAACGKVQAKTPGPLALEMPMPPPRLVVPVSVDPPPAPEPPPAAQPAPVVTAPPKPAASSTSTPPPPTAPPNKPPDRPATPEAPPNATAVELRERAQALIAEARANLGKVDFHQLNTDAKDQFTQAQRFITVADDALKKRNYLYARDMAEKGANLAAQLVKRWVEPSPPHSALIRSHS